MHTRIITNGDSLLGYAVAFKFLTASKSESYKYRIFCREKQTLKELELLGAEVIETDYKDEALMCRMLRGVSYIMLVPEYSSNRIKEAQLIMKCAKKEKVDYMTLFSYIGVNSLEKVDSFPLMKEYIYLEQLIPKYFDNNSYTVMRIPIFYQFFYYLGPMMEDENKICLPVSDHAKWCAIDMKDALDAIYKLSNPTKENTKNKTQFQFTPERNYNSEDLITAANEGLDRGMTYKEVKRTEMIKYLERMSSDNRFTERPPEDPSLFPLGQYLNKYFVNTLVEYWQMSHLGYTDTITNDLKDAIDHQPLELKKFFSANRHQFKRLR